MSFNSNRKQFDIRETESKQTENVNKMNNEWTEPNQTKKLMETFKFVRWTMQAAAAVCVIYHLVTHVWQEFCVHYVHTTSRIEFSTQMPINYHLIQSEEKRYENAAIFLSPTAERLKTQFCRIEIATETDCLVRAKIEANEEKTIVPKTLNERMFAIYRN